MKLLASDFDNTLYFSPEDPHFHPQDLKAIKRFQETGNVFGICTGRDFDSIHILTKDFLDFDFYILDNGSVILNHERQVIAQFDLDLTTVRQVLTHFNQLESMVVTNNRIYAYHNTRQWKSDQITLITEPAEITEATAHRVSFHLETEAQAQAVTNELNGLGLPIRGFQNGTEIDCVNWQTSKGHALKIIQDYYGLADRNVACIGDSYNDLPMLDVCANGFTFKGSPQIVRDHAKYMVASLYQAIDQLTAKKAAQAAI
ncbi:HAD family hydrolase [Lapidilactobacillus luobeiensis]|uniref:HAD family hydrolase n=1 Tax=Lapidilactobacillus luobeiensis TaxID=2950371 RepID=UPI0021C32600|nr:HAD family hydrolase [Lapidilactobacillus luobeiensis]